MPPKPKIITQAGINITWMTCINRYTTLTQALGKRNRQHAVGLLRLAVGRIVVVGAAPSRRLSRPAAALIAPTRKFAVRVKSPGLNKLNTECLL
jgi:hypothetical protein